MSHSGSYRMHGIEQRATLGRYRVRMKQLFRLTLLSLLFPSVGIAESKPLNVLFILTDNQPASIIGAYGNPDVRTPNIDRLASEGMRFDNAFAVNGMCSPTRATLMTGLMPSQHGVHNWLDDEEMKHWPREWSAVAEFRTLPLTLANRGYSTAMIGKWHLGQPWQASIGYQHWVTFTDGHTVDFWNNDVIDNDDTYPVKDKHIVDFFADKAVEYIEKQGKDKPFYLQLNFDGPYLNPPTNNGPAKNRHYKSYVGDKFESFPRVPVNANIVEQLSDPKVPPFLKGMHKKSILHHNDPESMANVASQNTVVDDGVGRVLEALEKAGLAETTLVIFSSDQGNFYGQHGLWQHNTVTTPANLYEAALNVPLVIRHPDHIAPSQTSKALIGQYDIPVTILDYLGFGNIKFDRSPGRSFVGLLNRSKQRMTSGDNAKHAGEWEDLVFYEQEESRGVRTPEYAYWSRIKGTGAAELYDMRKDPAQLHNLAFESEMQPVVNELDQALTEFFTNYSDKKYDIWAGGTAKGSVMRPYMFKALFGEQWEPKTPMLPAFSE